MWAVASSPAETHSFTLPGDCVSENHGSMHPRAPRAMRYPRCHASSGALSFLPQLLPQRLSSALDAPSHARRQRQLSLNASRVSGLAHVERLLLHLKKFGSWCGLVPALETLPGFVPPMSPVQEGASMQWVAFAAMDGHIHFGWIAGWPLAWLQSLGPRMLKHAPMSHTFLLQLPEPPCGGREHIEQG
eukprot:350064-Chlamydomonas_euryale.AAC.6